MDESAALRADEVFPEQPIRQWVLSFPFQLQLFVTTPVICSYFGCFDHENHVCHGPDLDQ